MQEPSTPVAPAAAAAAPAASAASGMQTVLPAGFQARSRLDVAREAGDQQPLRDQLQPPGPDPVATLEAARAEDRARAQATSQRGTAADGSQRDDDGQHDGQGTADALLRMRPPNRSERRVNRNIDWQKLNQERDDYRARATQLERELAAARGGHPAPSANGQPYSATGFDITTLPEADLHRHPAIARLKAERDTFYEEVKHVRVEADPEFRAKYDGRRDAAIGIAKRAAGGAADDIAKILGNSDPEVRRSLLAERLTSGNFSDATKTKLAAVVGQLDSLEVERELEVASRKATWESTQAARTQAQQATFADRARRLDNEFDAVLAKWTDEQHGMPFFVDDKVKAHVVPLARQVFSGEASAAQLAEASIKSVLFEHVLKGWQGALNEVQRLQGANGRYVSSYPGSDSYTAYDGGDAGSNPPPINPNVYDHRFATGLQGARQLDHKGAQWGG